MKKYLLISVIVALISWNASAQTADAWVSQGRSYLSAKDIASANNCFAQALATSPTNANANTFYATTRLLMLPNQPAGSNFLTRIGIPLTGRNIYNWLADPVTDTNDLPVAPAGVAANEFTAQLRTNALPVIAGAITNLAVITDTNFTINLTSSETTTTAVTMDYGDLKLIQAWLYGAEYAIYLLNAQNLDAQLATIRALYTNNTISVQRVLTDYPQLLTFATTNDLQSARAAFTNAVNAYMTASAFIRNRPVSVVRLFNFDQAATNGEADFRSALQDSLDSLAGARVLSLATNYSICMSNQFTGKTTMRSLLPQFSSNDIVLGTLPDLTFGGLITGLAQADLEESLAGMFTMLPVGGKPVWQTNSLQLPFNTVRNHYYVLQMSTNLTGWSILNYFTATSSITKLVDVLAGAPSKRFYRLRDDSANLAFGGTVRDQPTGLPIAGATVVSIYDGSSTVTDANGNFYLATTVPAHAWAYAYLQFSAPGHATTSNWYYGDGLVSGLQIYLSPPVPPVQVVNSGFETGDFSGWTLSGDTCAVFVDGSASGIAPYSGNYEAVLGTCGSLGYLSQTLSTTAGASYLLSFRLANPFADPGEFQVLWNGAIIFNTTNIAGDWTNIQLVVTSTGTSTVLQFGFQDDPGYLFLDGISVTPIP